jgi:eukaryotic-like serine/threonine-protein kinase
MTPLPPRQDRISTLYHQALERPPEQRRAFLEHACNGDESLRAEVESLLAYDDDSFLEQPFVAARKQAVTTGDRFGPYIIGILIGAGGMGEVYRARDTKLGRDVAIKMLPSHFTSDPERRARFEREARVLATLNHPHIGAIHGLEESDGITALVLELIEGPTLADRLQRGPLPVSEALAIARQIAEALDAAHEKGIVHRDLKPANIVLQPTAGPLSSDARVKVLDFGLAKTAHPSDGPTISVAATETGRALGTPAYMSPEQARGLAVDKRTDIWAFGCVVFEMLTGRRAFEGATVSDTLVRILDSEPDWAKLPAQTPGPIRTLLERCLRKDPHKRLHDIADARIEIESASTDGAEPTPAAPRSVRERLAWIVAATLAIALIVVTLLYLRSAPQPPTEVVEFPVAPVEDSLYSGNASEFAISPDGRHLAFAASNQGVSMLWVRSISTSELRVLPGTEGARGPFWKPDSESLGFFANEQLKTIRLNGGSPVVLCGTSIPGPSGPGATWGAHDVIVFGDSSGALKQIGANNAGGNATPATVLGATDFQHRWPEFFPDGERFLYLSQGKGPEQLRVGFVNGAPSVSLGPTESHGAYAAGYLFFVRGGNLMAEPFDAITLKPTGDPVIIAMQAGVNAPWQRGMFSISSAGRLAYNRTARIPSDLTWLDRHGKSIGTAGDRGVYFNMNLSPEQHRVAISRMTERPGTPAQFDIWIIDLTRANAPYRLTDDPAWEFDPSWSPDGRVVFNSNRPDPQKGLYKLFVRAANGSRQDEPLPADGEYNTSPDWSRDGRFIVYTRRQAGTGLNPDLWTFEPNGDGKSRSFLSTQYDEANGVFSPDTKWIAYESDASGGQQVYVRPFPVQTGLFPISRDGGWGPRWRGDGKELFFLAPDGTMMSASIDTANGFAAGVPQKLFPTRLRPGNARAYDVSADGQRFLIPQIGPGTPITVVLNWPALLTTHGK